MNKNQFFKDTKNFEMYCLEMNRSYQLTVNNKRTLLYEQIINSYGTILIDTKPI